MTPLAQGCEGSVTDVLVRRGMREKGHAVPVSSRDHRQLGALILAALVFCRSAPATGQTLRLPPRPADAAGGTALVSLLAQLPRPEREEEIFRQIMCGNVPPFLRALVAVTDTARVGRMVKSVTFYVTPDYMAVGADDDYLLIPMTPLLAQKVADALGCSLPTRKMVDAIYRASAVKLRPEPIPPSAAMTTIPVFSQHQEMVRVQRAGFLGQFPLGALVAGHKKDVIVSNDIYMRLRAKVPRPVVIYGWHTVDGRPIQRLYNGHGETYADYSHGIRLVQRRLTVEGIPLTVPDVLSDPGLCALLSDEGTIPKASYSPGSAAKSP